MTKSHRQYLNFNYPMKSSVEISHEKEIKQQLRDTSFNILEPREIERFSDKYISQTDYKSIMETINKELAGPELVKLYGVNYTKKIDRIVAEEDEYSAEEVEKEISEDQSLAGGDDYEVYENDDSNEELVDEKNEGYM